MLSTTIIQKIFSLPPRIRPEQSRQTPSLDFFFWFPKHIPQEPSIHFSFLLQKLRRLSSPLSSNNMNNIVRVAQSFDKSHARSQNCLN